MANVANNVNVKASVDVILDAVETIRQEIEKLPTGPDRDMADVYLSRFEYSINTSNFNSQS